MRSLLNDRCRRADDEAWWDALDVSCEAVPNVAFCGRFDNEGVGYSIHVGFDWQPNVNYTFRLWRDIYDVQRDAYWWRVEIRGPTGDVLAPVGAILVRSGAGGISSIVQWTEWFGNVDHCDEIPETQAWFGNPLLDGVASQPIEVGTGSGQICPSQSVWSNGGARQRFGTSTPSVAIVQAPFSTWMQPRYSVEGSGTWIAAVNDPTAPPGGLPPSYVYAHTFAFTNSSAEGFIGLVTASNGKYAILTAKDPAGGSHDAVVAFDWKPGRFYFPLVHQLSPGVWGGWIYDHQAATWTQIGVLSLPPAWGQLSSFSKTTAAWFGPTASSCSAFPQADVFFSAAFGFGGGQTTVGNSVNHLKSYGTCAAQATPVADIWVRYTSIST